MTIYDQMTAQYAQKRGTATQNVEQEVPGRLVSWRILPACGFLWRYVPKAVS